MVKSFSRKKSIAKVGDRIKSRDWMGTVISNNYTSIFPYRIKWDNGHEAIIKEQEFTLRGYEVLAPEPDVEDIEEEELNLWESCGGDDFPREQEEATCREGITAELTWKDWAKGDRVCSGMNGKRGVVERLRFRPQSVSILWDGTTESIEYSPVDLELLEIRIDSCSDNLTSVPVSASDSPLQDSSSDLPLLDFAKSTITAEISSASDTQAYPSSGTSSDTTGEPLEEESTSLQLPLLVSLSQSKGNDSPPTTSEIVSPTSSKRSPKSSRRTSRSKTSKACSVALSDPEAKNDTSAESSPTFPSAGTMSSGSWSAADTLERPSLESGCSWLESPSGLSAQGRVPGQSRLEAQLKSDEHLQDGQTINPAFLEDAFEIPLGWTDPLELRAATELLEVEEKRSATVLTPESPPSPSVECSTLTESLKTEEELTPVDESAVGKHYWCDRLDVTVTVESVHNWRATPQTKELTKAARCRPWWGNFPDVLVIQLDDLVEVEELSCPLPDRSLDTQIPVRPITGISQDSHPVIENGDSLEKPIASRQVGCLTQYAPNKKGIRYPRVEGVRDKFNDTHWYWNFGYKELDPDTNKWVSCSVPVKMSQLAEVRFAIRSEKPYTYILQQVLGKD